MRNEFMIQNEDEVLGELEINETEKIEDFKDLDCIRTDFANEYIGGKVLIEGNV